MASIINQAKISEMRSKSVQSLPNRLKDGAQRLKNAITAPGEILTEEVNRIVGELNSEIGGKVNKSVIDASDADASKILLSKQEINKLIAAAEVRVEARAKLAAHPINSIYTSTDSTSPETLFGGKWEQLTKDAYFKIVTSEAGKYDGTSASHVIPDRCMPEHTHDVDCTLTQAVERNDKIYLVGTHMDGMRGKTSALYKSGNNEAYHPYFYGLYAWRRTA